MYPQEYIQYMVYFHVQRDYFECHEILEEYWKKEQESPFQAVWLGLIQVAVALYHQRRNNMAGALKLMENAYRNLNGQRRQLEKLGIQSSAFLTQLNQLLQELKKGRSYTSFNIPLQERLFRYCLELYSIDESSWGTNEDISNHTLHKHTLRDRNAVLAARNLQKSLREKKRLVLRQTNKGS